MSKIRHEASRTFSQRSESEFGELLGTVLSPSRPLQSVEFLRGRETQVNGIKESLYAPGRHVLIHGFRGVGKSSLAQTTAFSNSIGADPLIVGCDNKSTFASIIADIFNEACNKNPNVEKRVRETSFNLSYSGVGYSEKTTVQEGLPSPPSSVNTAVRQIQFLCDHYAKGLVVVIDEFDQLAVKDEQKNFASFIKQISDKHVTAKFIVCGIGESITSIMAAHESADRYFHTVALTRLPYEARYEIIQVAADSLGIDIDEDSMIRIARISDGFPHYVHFLAEKLFWRVFRAENGGKTTPALFDEAMSDAASSMEMKLRSPYEMATQKYRNDYELVLWAAADGHELRRRSTDIFEAYLEIAKRRGIEGLNRAKFNQRINSLKRPSHGSILLGSRQGWYEFTEKVVRGYVRLRAEQEGIVLEADHPAAPRRFLPAK